MSREVLDKRGEEGWWVLWEGRVGRLVWGGWEGGTGWGGEDEGRLGGNYEEREGLGGVGGDVCGEDPHAYRCIGSSCTTRLFGDMQSYNNIVVISGSKEEWVGMCAGETPPPLHAYRCIGSFLELATRLSGHIQSTNNNIVVISGSNEPSKVCVCAIVLPVV